MEYSIINNQNLEDISLRLDAEYYRPIFLTTENQIKRKEWDYLVNLSKSIKSFGAYSLCNQVEYIDKGIPFLRCKDIKDGLVDPSDVLFIDGDANQLLWKSEVMLETVLFTMSGTVGNSAIATEDLVYPINSNQDIAKIITNDKLNPYYLCIFLQSNYGKRQILRLPIGSVQQHIFLWQIERLIIPSLNNVFQKSIEKIFKLALTSKMNAGTAYSQAQTLLLSELGLLDWKPKHSLSFIKKYSDTQQAERCDAEYFQPKYDEIVEKLVNKHCAKPIGDYDIFDITTGQYSDEYVESNEGAPYIRGTDLTNGSVDIDNLLYLPIQSQIESKKAKVGDVVVTRVGTIGLSARIPKECEGGTISDNLIRIRISDQEIINTYYLSVYLNSIVGKELMLRNGRGSVQQRLNQETLKEIVFPILPFDIQLSIAEKITESFSLRKQSKYLLECAKKAIDMAIEEDEETAMQWLKSQIENIGRDN